MKLFVEILLGIVGLGAAFVGYCVLQAWALGRAVYYDEDK